MCVLADYPLVAIQAMLLRWCYRGVAHGVTQNAGLEQSVLHGEPESRNEGDSPVWLSVILRSTWSISYQYTYNVYATRVCACLQYRHLATVRMIHAVNAATATITVRLTNVTR